MATATITAKGQTTIPKMIREKLHLKPGDRLEFVPQDNGTVLLIPATLTIADIQSKIPPPPHAVSLEEMDSAIRRHAVARARRR